MTVEEREALFRKELNDLKSERQALEDIKNLYTKKVRLWKTLLVITISSNICLMMVFIKFFN